MSDSKNHNETIVPKSPLGDFGGSFFTYRASAGSGKTYTLAVEYIKQLLLTDDAYAHRHVLAVTFTKDATSEMKERILVELYGIAANLPESDGFVYSVQEKLSEAGKQLSFEEIRTSAKRVLSEILHDYGRFHVGTIDSFFQRVLRNLARELGKGSRFNIELNTRRIVDEAVNRMIEQSNENPELLDWIEKFIFEKLEQGASWRIDKELKQFGMNIFNEYFQEHENSLRHQLKEKPDLIAQMVKTHRSLKQEFESKMHSFAHLFFKIIQENDINPEDLVGGSRSYPRGYYNKLLRGEFGDDIFNSFLQKCSTDANKWTGSKIDKSEKARITQLAESMLIPLLQSTEHYRQENLIRYNSSVLVLKNIHQLALLWDIALEMEAQNKENNRFMLSQTALFLNQMINDSDASFIYEKIGTEIKHVMIDEFQDTSRLQWRNFKALLSEVIANNYFSLVVGDVKQSIYRWRNGDWNILNSIDQEIASCPKTLNKNFRSEQAIVEFNNSFFVQASDLLHQSFTNEFGELASSPFPSTYKKELVEQIPVKANGKGFISIDFVGENKDEGVSYREASLKRMLEHLLELQQQDIKPEQICILTRTNVDIRMVAEYLSAQKKNYPTLQKLKYLDIVSNDAFQLAASPALQIIVEALHCVSNWENPVHQAQLLLMWQNSIQPDSASTDLLLSQNEQSTDSFLPEGFRSDNLKNLQMMPLYELVLHIYKIFQLEKITEQGGYLFTFLDNLNNYLRQNSSDLEAFLNYWDDDLKQKSVPNESDLGGIRAMTIHKSKGLQFHTVLVAFCDWKMSDSRNGLVWCKKKEAPFDLELLPVNHNKIMYQSLFAKEYAEETAQLYMDNLNIAYVAFTRAEKNLFILSKYEEKGALRIAHLLFDLSSNNLLDGKYDDEKQSLTIGSLYNETATANEKTSENRLKQSKKRNTLPVKLEIFDMPNKKDIFRQSNKSKEFIAKGENPVDNEYIQQGNVMHELFSNIQTTNDISKAIERLVFDGLITSSEKENYRQTIVNAVQTVGVERWFDGSAKLFNECAIIRKDNYGKTQIRRPDRVMIFDDEVIVVDYKFGEINAQYNKQVAEYIQLIKQMNLNNVKGYLWYVEKNILEEVK